MNIIIDDTDKLCEIQKKFNTRFPFLKLEFFGYNPDRNKVFAKSNVIVDTNKTLGDIRHVHKPGKVSINGHQKVRTLEQHFLEDVGVNIQVFRKSVGTWLLTTITDEWTLSEQNKMGEEMNTSVGREKVSDYDEYHEQV